MPYIMLTEGVDIGTLREEFTNSSRPYKIENNTEFFTLFSMLDKTEIFALLGVPRWVITA